MPKPISLTDIKPCLLRQGYSSIKVSSTLELLQKPRIILNFGKQGCELLFWHRLKVLRAE